MRTGRPQHRMDHMAVFEVHDAVRVLPAMDRRLELGAAATSRQHFQRCAVLPLHLVHRHAALRQVVMLLLLYLHAQRLGVRGRRQQQRGGTEDEARGDEAGSDAIHGDGFSGRAAPMRLCSKNGRGPPANAVTKKAATGGLLQKIAFKDGFEAAVAKSRGVDARSVREFEAVRLTAGLTTARSGKIAPTCKIAHLSLTRLESRVDRKSV